MLVIGNGFDLALGLPTKYKDFLDFTYMMHDVYNHTHYSNMDTVLKCIYNFGKILMDPTNLHSEAKKKRLQTFSDRFKEAFEDESSSRVLSDFHYCAYNNIWINYFQEKYDKNLLVGENWIDFEKEIKTVIQLFESDIFDIKETVATVLDKDYTGKIEIAKRVEELRSMRMEHTKRELSVEAYNKFREVLREEFDKFVMALGIYLDYFVPRYDNDEKFSHDICQLINDKKNKPDCVLCFNYVNNFNIMYRDEPSNTSNTCFIHGMVNYVNEARQFIKRPLTAEDEARYINELIKKNNMIIGFDEYLNDDKKNDKLDFVYYRKFFQRISKGTGSQYLDWLDEYKTRIKNKPVYPSNGETREEVYSRMILQEAKKKPHHVFIFGHSLDATDKDIFRDLFLREPNDTKITIYYHDEDAHERIIANLIRMLTQEVVIKKTHGIDPDIEFIAQAN